MSDKAFRLSLSFLSIFSALVLTVGILLSVFTSQKPAAAENNIPVDVQITETENPANVIDTSHPESFDSLIESVTALRNRYPDYLRIYTVGYSEGGREILMYTLGSGSKKALVIGSIHAREHITTKYLLKVTEEYCNAAESVSGYYGNYDIRSLLNEYTLYIIPCANPDGVEIVLSNDVPESNVRVSKLSEYKANKNGVDLNRNFPLAWEYINNGVTAPADYYFKGYESASEKETQVLMGLCLENNFSFMISVHIKGNCIFWGDTYKTNNNPLYKAFAEDICDASGLSMTEPTKKAKDYGGGFENWFRHTFERPGVCIELSDNTNKIEPCTNKNYTDFDSFVNYEKSSNTIAAAMTSTNK
ncbi:MAG: M14 family zinc carboxypeptidase [Acutalibacteraceae bacterium]